MLNLIARDAFHTSWAILVKSSKVLLGPSSGDPDLYPCFDLLFGGKVSQSCFQFSFEIFSKTFEVLDSGGQTPCLLC